MQPMPFQPAYRYYAFVAGLPELLPGQSQAPMSVQALDEALAQLLRPQDREQLRLLQYPRSHAGLLAEVQEQPKPEKESYGVFHPSEFEERLQLGEGLPVYMHQFYSLSRGQGAALPALQHELSRLYYQYVSQKAIPFTLEWLTFDKRLRNFLSAWNLAQWGGDANAWYFLDAPEALCELPSQAQLSRDYPLLGRLLQEFNRQPAAHEREKAALRLRWAFLDQLLTFEDFTLPVLLGYWLKLNWLEESLAHTAQAGRRRVSQFIHQHTQNLLR